MRRLALTAALAGLALAAPAANAEDTRDCFWQGGNRTVNIAYPDLGARYWVSAFPLPPGTELIFKGQYPHARYASFNVYDPALQPTDGLADADIEPDAGSSNPFLPGARRDGAKRSYSVRVVSGTPPAKRERNTLYLNTGGQGALAGQIIYRVYVPDSGQDVSGGVGLPEVSMKLPTGQVLDQPATCQARDTGTGQLVDGVQANTDGPGADPANPAAQDPIRWEAFFNYAQAFSYPLGSTPAAGGRAVVPRDKLGGFLSNVDNAYTFALASRGLGPVLVLQGKAPVTPKTLGGEDTMGDGQVRYWSLCENEFASQRVVDCLYDEQVPVDSNGRFTVVMSTPGARPRNARAACGVGWMSWGVQPDGFVILRHMLPSVSFAQAIQRVSQAGTEKQVIGDYLPDGRHTTKGAFEGRGCAGATAAPRTEPPKTGGCFPRRKLRITARGPKGARVKTARLRVNGKRVKLKRRGKRLGTTYDLNLVKGDTVRIVVTGRTIKAKRFTQTRVYKLCAKKAKAKVKRKKKRGRGSRKS